MNTHKWLHRFFWGCFIAFMAPSIPHIANFFHAFSDAGELPDWFWWITSYGVACSIDVTILWLCYTMSREKVGGWYKFWTWIFILLLTAVSGWLNWHDAEHNSAMAAHRLSGAYFPTIDPILASSFPVLVIMFTVMSSKILSARPKTVEALEQEAEELEVRLEVEDRIRRVRAQQTIGRASTWAHAGRMIWKEALSRGSAEPESLEPVPEVASQGGKETATQVPPMTEPVVEYYTVKDTAELLQCSERYVRELRAKSPSPLRWDEKAKAFTAESVHAYAAQRRSANGNGHGKTDMQDLAIIVQSRADAD